MNRGQLKLFYYGPLVAWMALIFLMSTSIGKDENSKALITRILQTIAPDLVYTFTGDQLRFLDYILRKAGHIAEYFLLFCLALRALQFGRRSLRWQSLTGALILCLANAATDEIHQYFVAGRTGAISDVAIDFGGAALGSMIVLAWFWLKQVERGLWRKSESEISGIAADVRSTPSEMRTGIGPPAPNPGGEMP